MARILIVDDDLAIADLIKDALTPLGHDCVLTLSGAMAVDSVGKGPFDLVILDLNMPEMNGLQVLRAIRASPVSAKLKVLFCTSAEMMSETDEAFSAGATDCLVKPIDIEKLKAKVAQHTKAA